MYFQIQNRDRYRRLIGSSGRERKASLKLVQVYLPNQEQPYNVYNLSDSIARTYTLAQMASTDKIC